MKTYWNNGWEYTPIFTKDFLNPKYKKGEYESVTLPHTNVTTPYHYFDEASYQLISGYRMYFIPDESWKGQRVLLTFEGIAHHAVVYLNGKEIGAHKGGYTAFTVDLNHELDYQRENVLAVQVDSRESLNIPPFGNVIDYMTYGGIYRNAYIQVKDNCYIEDVFAQTDDVLTENKKLLSQITIHGHWSNITLKQIVRDGEEVISEGEKIPFNSSVLEYEIKTPSVQLWNLETPKLYTLITILYAGEHILDTHTTRIGFRKAEFRKDGFYLNGEKIKIRGLNRHQSFPYVGYAMPARTQFRDAYILKNELHVNAVRTSHYPQDQSFFNACDELGLLVFTEIPGWQHIGDENWKNIACDNLKEMIIENRNHPSIILWGVRINESQDDDSFYEKTNKIAHSLDSTRQTGGVRFLQKSNLLEDVYTYNDFLHNGSNEGVDNKKKVTTDMNKGYLISEYNGHMFPTKSFDNEEYRLEHALRHARVIDSYYGKDDIAGGFGWCMFDYNTHQDFGSGDRICYHGVMDMFRNPKLASAVYASQNEREVVMELSSSMDIGEHPACNIGTVYAFTNADSVRLYKNDDFVKEFYPDKKNFPNMPHPPIAFDDFVGELMEKGEGFEKKKAEQIKEVLLAIAKYGQNAIPFSYKLKMLKVMLMYKLKLEDGLNLYFKYIGNWGGKVTRYRFEAIKNGKVVKTIVKEPTKKLELEAISDTTELMIGESYDVASIRLQMKDQNGNLLHLYQEPLTLIPSGPIQLIGSNVISLKGGMGGTFVRTSGEEGEASLTIYGEKIDPVKITFTVRR